MADPADIWRQEYKYDRFGNRRVASQTETLFTTGWDVTADPSDPEAARYNAQNRVDIAGSNWHYDAAGNIDRNVDGFTLGYDAENRLVAACSQELPCTATPGAGKTVYSYDGEGRRIRKKDPSGVETVYVYDSMGNLAAEYGGSPQAAGIQYVTADHLGSARLLTDGDGLPVERHDYLPFGGDVPADINGSFRAGLAAYAPDAPIRQRFTGKERDSETGLDYFGARYFSGAQGRFTSPDEPLTYADPGSPQSWNLYAYGFNNPLLYSDADGHEPCVNGVNPENGNICTTVTETRPPDMSWFTEMFLRSLVTTVQVAQQTQQVIQPAVDWFSQPRNPTCMAGYMGVGSSIGFWAGGGLGTLGLAGGPAAVATIPGGAAGGAALGGGVGGLGGMIMCSSGTWGGSGGGRGGDYREKTKGANANDREQINAAARRVGVDGRAFGRYVEKFKKLEGRGASENFSFDELIELARQFKAGGR